MKVQTSETIKTSVMADSYEKDTQQAYLDIWKSALTENGRDLQESFIREVCESFKITYDETLQNMITSEEKFNAHWYEKGVDAKDELSLQDFYNGTQLEIFELMDWHSRRVKDGPLNYVCALEIAKRLGKKNYLDYGSGVGSGALLFQSHGFKVSLADISSPLLDFANYRFARRKKDACYFDLKKTTPLDGAYDVITCFDVLEHVKDPLKMLRSIRKKLRPGGIAILTAPFQEDDGHPMHIVHDASLAKRFRSMGFQRLWKYDKMFSQYGFQGTGQVLHRVERTALGNFLYRVLDCYTPDAILKLIQSLLRLRSPKKEVR